MSEHCSLPLIDVFSERPNRFKSIRESLKKASVPDENSVLLEVACGDGKVSCEAANTYPWKVIGVDISEKRINQAKALAEEICTDNKPEFICGDLFKQDLGEVTHIFCENFFSSIPDDMKEQFAVLASERLCDGGYLMMYDFSVGKGGSEIEEEQIENIPCFVGIKKPETYKALFESHGFETVSMADKSMQLYGLGAHLSKSYGTEPSGLGKVLASVESVEKGIEEAPSTEEVEAKSNKIRNFFVDSKIGSVLMVYKRVR